MYAALFPGQGSQHSGMGRFLFDEFKLVRELFEEASDSLSLDFKKLCFEAPESELALTENTQSALLLVSTATYRALGSLVDFKPQAASGHSVGEYAALVSAQALPFSQALRAVRARGQAMQSAVPVGQGGMLAVMGLSQDQVEQLCRWVEEKSQIRPLEPANFNAPGQVVVSGQLKAIEWLQSHFTPEVLKPQPGRVKLIPLKVSAPFHCSMMKPAEEQMAPVLADMDFQRAQFPVVQNFVAEPVEEASALRENLLLQICGPVRWIECVGSLKALGVQRCIELGPGKVLSGLVKKIAGDDLITSNIQSLEDLKHLEKELK